MDDLETILQQAIADRSTQAEPALRDLDESISKTSDAIGKVSGGELDLVLIPLEPISENGDAYALAIRHGDDERTLRIFEFGEAGYPIKIWVSMESWQDRKDIKSGINTKADLEKYFRDLIGSPKSDIVAMLRYIKGNAPRTPEPISSS